MVLLGNGGCADEMRSVYSRFWSGTWSAVVNGFVLPASGMICWSWIETLLIGDPSDP
ncbi:MAG TPA: hypothetical protein VFR40_00405 [Lapillicoccus sp.]|nr:hypothetical protein [Lapillicoccus sp.]